MEKEELGPAGAVDRRAFLTTAGKFALVTPPAMTMLLSTSLSSPAIAASGVGGYAGGGSGGSGGTGGTGEHNSAGSPAAGGGGGGGGGGDGDSHKLGNWWGNWSGKWWGSWRNGLHD
jgi:hypothetical protein